MNKYTNPLSEESKTKAEQANRAKNDTHEAVMKNIKKEEYFKKELTHNIDRLLNDKQFKM
ncbi:hypothetical protein [Carboxylicivirga marina]|uniref:Uncharacterized protein n=1 Tax=Carboxylicivirga marina TaxID=2800988 RepID=A0ABS1HK61_9BACT|nr:hypothetical protein [Carboxylicivirga marina]MBK3518057.1 hypothetical protein [Carboxylicivirga marina]